MTARAKWKVHLGEIDGVTQFGRARLPIGLRVIGRVTKGAQFGALATNDEGQFFQVNGDHLQPLCKSQLHLAVKAARGQRPAQQSIRSIRSKPQTTAPQVIIKRRRSVVGPEETPGNNG